VVDRFSSTQIPLLLLYRTYGRFYRNVVKKASDRRTNLGVGGARAESSKSVEKTVIPPHSRSIHSKKARNTTVVTPTFDVRVIFSNGGISHNTMIGSSRRRQHQVQVQQQAPVVAAIDNDDVCPPPENRQQQTTQRKNRFNKLFSRRHHHNQQQQQQQQQQRQMQLTSTPETAFSEPIRQTLAKINYY
jgi:hypothetical protein